MNHAEDIKKIETELIRLEDEIETALIGKTVSPAEDEWKWDIEIARLRQQREDVWMKRKELKSQDN